MIKKLGIVVLILTALGFGSGVLKLPNLPSNKTSQAVVSTATAEMPLLILPSDANVKDYIDISEVQESGGKFSITVKSKTKGKTIQLKFYTPYPQFARITEGESATINLSDKHPPMIGIMPNKVN
jgi:hypothetical protein